MKSTPGQSDSAAVPARELRARLAEAEDALRAIRSGEVDAVVVPGPHSDRVFTLEGAGHAYRVLIESMNEGALTLAGDEMILYANHCFAKMVQCPLERMMGTSFRRFLSTEDLAALRPLLKLTDKSGAKVQVLLQAGDGSKIPAQISIRPLAGDGLGPAHVGMVVTDMTEARRAAQQQETERLYAQTREQAAELERRVAERTKQLLLATLELEAFESSVSHDLRGPLRHIVGFSQALIENHGAQLPEEGRDFLNKISEGAEKMEGLIVALLEFSRLNKRELSLQQIDVGRMWQEILAEMKLELGDRRIDVTMGELPPCHADPILFRQVLVNLLGNALKYSRTRACSVIRIAAMKPEEDGGAAYSIKDNGVGFNMAKSADLFTVFKRLHTAREFEGTGVGLSTVQRIIQRHGGRVWAESTPEAGATFYFTVGRPAAKPGQSGAFAA